MGADCAERHRRKTSFCPTSTYQAHVALRPPVVLWRLSEDTELRSCASCSLRGKVIAGRKRPPPHGEQTRQLETWWPQRLVRRARERGNVVVWYCCVSLRVSEVVVAGPAIKSRDVSPVVQGSVNDAIEDPHSARAEGFGRTARAMAALRRMRAI